MVTDKEFIDRAAAGLPIEAEPFARLASDLGLTQQEVVERLKRLVAEGKVKRFAASVRHQPMGYAHNTMLLVRVEAGRLDELGGAASRFLEVSHCYHRHHPDGDPDCLYIMIHTREKERMDEIINSIAALPGVRGVEVCTSLIELKKTSLSGVSSSLKR
jgi:DNA-binding Lrp family transcriptional regulator